MTNRNLMSQASPPRPFELSPTEFRELETSLAELDYRDIPVGRTLSDTLIVNLLWGHGDWSLSTRSANVVRRVRHRLMPKVANGLRQTLSPDRVLMTWFGATPRFDKLLSPVLAQIGPERCSVMIGPGPEPDLPISTSVVPWRAALDYQRSQWVTHYLQSRKAWAARLLDVCRRYALPRGTYELLFLHLIVSSQRIEGFLSFLSSSRPSLILTEYDRNHLWSCLVLAARSLGIPTVTLVHGVMRPDALGFSPTLADYVVAWGELDRGKFLEAGESPAAVLVGGCPRLTRELPVSTSEARRRLKLGRNASVALLATSPDRGRLALAESFCKAIEATSGIMGLVRLHPTEGEEDYREVASRYPAIQFASNTEMTLDESLAAADVVIVRGSGVGSDALVKRRPVVVLNPERHLSGNDRDLVDLAGCPLARTPQELSSILINMLGEGIPPKPGVDAERYVHRLCAAFGNESARLTADLIEEVLDRRQRGTLT